MRWGILWAKRLFTPLAIAMLGYVAWQARQTLATIFATAQLSYLLLTLLWLMIPHLIGAGCTTALLRACDTRTISYGISLYTLVNRLPARYLPGGIWHTVGRMMDFHARGITPAQLTALFLLEHLLSAGVPLILGGGIVYYYHGLTDYWGQLAALLAIGSGLGMIVVPVTIQWRVLTAYHFYWRFYLMAIGLYWLSWSLFALAFVNYFKAFAPTIGTLPNLEVAGTYLFSWGIGLIALFAPQGIGVFETVASHLLSVTLSVSILAALVAGFRVMALVADFSLWGILWSVFLLMGYRGNNQK